jgi:hypothetical protein
MSAQEKEFKGCLESTKQEIVDVNAKMLALGQAKEKAIEMGDGAAAIKSKHEAKALQERLEDLTITKAALEAKLRICKADEAKAEKVRVEISAAWNQLAPLVDTIIQAQESVKQACGEITKVQVQIGSLARKHSELVPENFETPILRFAKEIIYFPNIPLTPLTPWRYLTESERQAEKAARHEEERQRAIEQAPVCKKCNERMEPDRKMGHEGKMGSVWCYCCAKCGTRSERGNQHA